MADMQAIARAVAEALPSDVPLIATFTSAEQVAEVAGALTVEHASAQRTGSTNASVFLAVEPSLLEPLVQAGVLTNHNQALYTILETAAHRIGEGITRATSLSPQDFVHPSTMTFLLQAGNETRGWFAINFQEVATMFDEKFVAASDNTDGSSDETENMSTHTPAATEQAVTAAAFPSSTAASSTKPSGKKAPGVDAMRMLYDVEMTLSAEIGRAKMPVKQILELSPGTIVELDRIAGSPADLMVNGHLVARGEVVVVDEDYGLRITEIMDPEGML